MPISGAIRLQPIRERNETFEAASDYGKKGGSGRERMYKL
jgi:hypothetical protein